MGSSAILRLALRRTLSSKRLVAVVALGVFIAAILLASAPIYSRAMSDLGLTFTIRDQLAAHPGTTVEFSDIPLATNEGVALQKAVQARIQERIGWFQSSETRYTQLGRFGIAHAGDAPATGLVQAQPQSLPGYETRVRIIAGQLPQPTGKGQPMQLALSQDAAATAKLKPGDTFVLREGFDTCERILPSMDPPPPPPPCDPKAAAGFDYPAVITAIIEPLDPTDPFWLRPTSSYFDPFRLEIPDVGPILPMFTDERSITEGFAASYPSYRATIDWDSFAEPTQLNRANYKVAREDLRGLFNDMLPLNGTAFGPLSGALDDFGKNADHDQVPLTVLLLEISGIALFYVGLVSAIVVERQSAEIALLRSRGASMWQVASIYAWQGLLIGVPAVLAAPFLAAVATALLGATPTFHDATNGDLLPVTIPPLAFAAAAVGVVLSLLALMLPALLLARRSGVSQKRAEARPGASIIHRYYLDLVLAAAAGIVLFELHQRGSAFEPSDTGGLSSDPLLLASPALIIAAAAALVLRFYPMLLRLFARMVSAVAGVSVSLGLAQVVRNSGQYTRLTLLLMMAVAVGSFAASYASTTDRSYTDRAGYATGADLRAFPPGGGSLDTPATDLDAKAAKVPGVTVASGVTRSQAGFATTGVVTPTYQVLGVDPTAMSTMLWWRNDFSSQSLDGLMRTIEAAPIVPGKAIPGQQPDVISAWVKGDATESAMTLWARVRDANGTFATLQLGSPDTGGQWKQLSVSLSDSLRGDLKAPMTLVSILMSEATNRFAAQYTPMLIDDITVTDKAGNVQVIDDFEQGLHWGAFYNRTNDEDSIALAAGDGHSGKAAGKFTFHAGSTDETRGMFSTPQELPLPVLASDDFLKSAGMKEGGTATLLIGQSALVPVRIAGSFSLFPTAPTDDGPVLVFNRDQLTTWADTDEFSEATDLVPTEMMLSLAPNADEKAVETALSADPFRLARFDSQRQQLDSNRRNPLIAAGGSGILLLSFGAVLILVGVALLVSLLTSLGRRRTEFAVVRSMGVSRGQLFRMLALEYSVVAIAGTVVGAILGLVVGRQMLSFLNVTETGAKVEPGFILQTDWVLVAGAVGAVFVLFAVALALATFVMAAIADAQALRTE